MTFAHMLAATLPALQFPSGADVVHLLPELIVGGGFIVTMVLDTLIPPSRKSWLAAWSLLVLLASGAVTVIDWVTVGGQQISVYAESFSYDRFGLFINALILIAAIFVVALSPSYLERQKIHHGEFYSLILAASAGMMFLGSSESLMMVFLSIEVLSLALYLLSGFRRGNTKSQEAGFKYFLMGGFASAILLMGMALVYGETGHTQLPAIAQVVAADLQSVDPLLLTGIVLVFVGLGFKVSAAPFHMWTPDVYEGAPLAVTAFMSVATKVAAFAAILRIFSVALTPLYTHWEVAVSAISILSMLIGNLVALRQTNIKRMLAYSGIAQAGYMLIGVAVSGSAAIAGVLVYLAAYTLSTFGVLAGVMLVAKGDDDSSSYRSLRGLGHAHPYVAAMMALSLLSLAGFPPLLGFWGKFFVFTSAIQNGQIALAIWGVLTSAISIFYYIRVILILYSPQESEQGGTVSWLAPARVGAVVVGLGVAATVVLGVFVPVVYHLALSARDALLVRIAAP